MKHEAFSLVSFVLAGHQRPVQVETRTIGNTTVLCLPGEQSRTIRHYAAYVQHAAHSGVGQIMETWQGRPSKREIREISELGYLLDCNSSGKLVRVSAALIALLQIQWRPTRLTRLCGVCPNHQGN